MTLDAIAWHTLDEAIEYLNNATGGGWTPRRILRLALEKASKDGPTIIWGVLPNGIRYKELPPFTEDELFEMSTFMLDLLEMRIVPLSPRHVSELLARGETFVDDVRLHHLLEAARVDITFADRLIRFYANPEEEPLPWVDLPRCRISARDLRDIVDGTRREPSADLRAAEATAKGTEKARGITKNEVAQVFDGVRFASHQWHKYLADPPNWLKECRVSRGRKGDRSNPSLWNPVLIAAELHALGVQRARLDAIFDSKLQDWQAEWREASSLF